MVCTDSDYCYTETGVCTGDCQCDGQRECSLVTSLCYGTARSSNDSSCPDGTYEFSSSFFLDPNNYAVLVIPFFFFMFCFCMFCSVIRRKRRRYTSQVQPIVIPTPTPLPTPIPSPRPSTPAVAPIVVVVADQQGAAAYQQQMAGYPQQMAGYDGYPPSSNQQHMAGYPPSSNAPTTYGGGNYGGGNYGGGNYNTAAGYGAVAPPAYSAVVPEYAE
eukprot:GHVR01053753.1.p1 GENE.GHVR01053753.1~~GHVR01053753.1.p1  ORF type:complete len:216 (+),score=21.18 GHVR01053753.1:68-715(+)